MQTLLRLSSFLAIFALMASWETLSPRRALNQPRLKRWLTNLSILAVDALLLRLMGSAVAYTVAVNSQAHGWGWLNNVNGPYSLEFAIALIVLDFALYLQHRLSHQLPWLWRLHQVHHTDLDIDLTSGVRFHPVEIGLSMLYKIVLVIILGAAPAAVLVFEIVLNGAALFNHSNVYIPAHIDRLLRVLIVTPDLHRVHHSVLVEETDSNFGFSLSCWDYLCGSYRAAAKLSQPELRIGLDEFRDFSRLRLIYLLALPFHRRARNNSDAKSDNSNLPIA